MGGGEGVTCFLGWVLDGWCLTHMWRMGGVHKGAEQGWEGEGRIVGRAAQCKLKTERRRCGCGCAGMSIHVYASASGKNKQQSSTRSIYAYLCVGILHERVPARLAALRAGFVEEEVEAGDFSVPLEESYEGVSGFSTSVIVFWTGDNALVNRGMQIADIEPLLQQRASWRGRATA